jgi:hypothetical protein
MDSFVSDLRERFDYSVTFFESAWEHDPNGMIDDRTVRPHTEEESRMIDIFERLSETVETIPPEVLREAEELRTKLPETFEEILFSLIRYVGAKYTAGGYFEPTSAGEFVEKLIEYVRLRVTNPSLFTAVPYPDAVS